MTLCTLAGFDNICLSQCQSFGFSHGSATRHWSICFIALTAWASDLMQCYIPGPQQVQTKNALTANAMSCHTMKLPFAHMSVFYRFTPSETYLSSPVNSPPPVHLQHQPCLTQFLAPELVRALCTWAGLLADETVFRGVLSSSFYLGRIAHSAYLSVAEFLISLVNDANNAG